MRPPPNGSGGSPQTDKLFEQFYRELRELAGYYMAGERANHTLQPTGLVNEAYTRLAATAQLDLVDRAHFMRVAAKTMRRILVDHAREKRARKRGGDLTRVTVTDFPSDPDPLVLDLIDLDTALDKLGAISERQVNIVELRFFAGLTIEETAKELDVSPGTVKTESRVAKAWLRRELSAS